MKNISQIRDVANCSEQSFFLFDRDIVFSPAEISYTNLFEYFNNLKIKYSNRFFEEYDKCEYIENNKDNFQNTLDITTQLFDEICKEVNELWLLSGISPHTRSSDFRFAQKFENRPVELALHMPYDYEDYKDVTFLFSLTTVGRVEALYEELKSAERELEFNEEYRQRQKFQRSRTWVGGGFGFSGAVKGAITAGFLNLAEDGLASLKGSLANSNAYKRDKQKIDGILKEIKEVYATDMKLIGDINTLIDLLFVATIICANQYVIGETQDFSYSQYAKAMKGIEQYSSDFQKEQLIKAIKAYPYVTSHYEYIEKYFPEENDNVAMLKSVFCRMKSMTVPRNLNEERKNKEKVAENRSEARFNWGMGHDCEISGNKVMAAKFYLKAYDLDPQDKATIDALERLGVDYPGKKKETVSVNNNLYQTFFTDLSQIYDKAFLDEGYQNAQMINGCLEMMSETHIYPLVHGSKNEQIARFLAGDNAELLIAHKVVKTFPNTWKPMELDTHFEGFEFVNGRTIVAKVRYSSMESLLQGLGVIKKSEYVKSAFVIQNNINGIVNRCNSFATPSRKKGCYITTAVCASYGKPDDCYELMQFRNFRDNWLKNQPDGEALISQYYEEAPQIIDSINLQTDSKRIYESIYNEYLSKCLLYIENKEYDKCKRLYVDMVNALKEKYILNKV